jgi:hypothetical protein
MRRRSFLSRRRKPTRTTPLAEWFHVRFNDDGVQVRAEPPDAEPWEIQFSWLSVIRVCFKAEDLTVSDGIYIFTSARPESYVIPTEADGGAQLWQEIIRRGMFDPELAIQAALSNDGIFVWPPVVPDRTNTEEA